jgi:hypothetical protein
MIIDNGYVYETIYLGYSIITKAHSIYKIREYVEDDKIVKQWTKFDEKAQDWLDDNSYNEEIDGITSIDGKVIING